MWAAGRSATGRRPRRARTSGRSPKPSAREPQGGAQAAGDRAAAVHGRGRVHGAHMGVALRRPDAPSGPVEGGTGRARRAGVLDLRAAQQLARLPVVDECDVGGGVAPESHRAGAGVADARVLLPRAQGPLRPPADQRGVFRCTDRALEEARLVRALRPRAVRRRARQIQRRDGRDGSASSSHRISRHAERDGRREQVPRAAMCRRSGSRTRSCAPAIASGTCIHAAASITTASPPSLVCAEGGRLLPLCER